MEYRLRPWVSWSFLQNNNHQAVTNPTKKIATHQSTYTVPQTIHPQLPNKSRNLSAIDYPVTPLTSIFLTKTTTYTTSPKTL